MASLSNKQVIEHDHRGGLQHNPAKKPAGRPAPTARPRTGRRNECVRDLAETRSLVVGECRSFMYDGVSDGRDKPKIADLLFGQFVLDVRDE